MTKKQFGNSLLLTSVIFSIIYNSAFGWNLFPQSPSELICDIIAVGGLVAGFTLRKL